MRRRAAVLMTGVVLLAFAGCGDDGGSGDEEAFCDALEELSDLVADGDLATDDGLEDAVDQLNDLVEVAAEGEQDDAVREVGELLEDADPDEAPDTAEEIQDELGDIAEDDCDIDEDDFAIAPEVTTTTTEPVDDTTTTTGDIDDTTTLVEGDVEVNARQEIPADFEADEDVEAAQACYDGDPAACDSLYASTAIGSVAEEYGSTCGGRVAEPTEGHCTEFMTDPIPVPSDVVDTATAQACFDGDMVACDELFQGAEEGSTDYIYGALCAGRVTNTSALCVEIYGEQALN